MKRRWSWGLVALLTATGLNGATADDVTTRKELQTVYDQAVKAYRARDLKGLMTIFAPGFINTSPDGSRLDRPEVEEGSRQLFAAMKEVKEMTLKAGKVTVKGNQATTTADLRLNATLVDEQGNAQPLVLRQTSSDTWKKTTAGWKMTRRDELTSD